MSAHGQPAPAPRWARAGEFRPWAREERQAYDALVQARENGDPALIAEARRAHRETVARMPACALPRRRR
jgi:hypothetical protein